MKTTEISESNINSLFEKIASVIEEARRRASTAINLSEVYAKFNVGRYIVEDEQGGNYKAEYGKQVLKQLSERLTARYGKGWSVETLTLTRKFYQTYSNSVNSVYEISSESSKSSGSKIINSVYEIQPSSPELHKFVLSCSH